MADPPVVALFGATALGKTDVAVAVAERLQADVVVADSMQVYAGLAIVTNQPDAAQRATARHHLVGFIPPQRDYTVAEYAVEAHAVIDGLRAGGRPVVVEGGSGLYLRAALGDLDFGGPSDTDLRRQLEERWAVDPEGMAEELRRRDPETWARIDRANPRRLLRALEAVLAGGGPITNVGSERLWRPAERYRHRLVTLDPGEDRAALARRIDARVDAMLTAGAADEVAAARARGPLSRTVLQAIGVREILAYLDGRVSKAEAAAAMKTRTRALVRRQLTWMRKLPEQARVTTAAGPDAAAEAVLALLRERPW
jgi:tRNA dimethylallyltransferase